ncbi:hypothetical protein DL96DRAFT_1550752 [Flagelloscypha sp. PMI_526]|nr:hypothetical protein DL96DRAFT_1550752 [Flagelloscypha sp. PMI_526]
MRIFAPISFLWLCVHSSTVVRAFRQLHTLPEDIHANPKFRVSFLNGQPLLHETAQRWLQDGLRGGELEFTNVPWDEWPVPPPLQGIEGQETFAVDQTNQEGSTSSVPKGFSLELMKLGPKERYLCFIPDPLPETPRKGESTKEQEPHTPAQSLALLNSLWGKCLYHRHGWFTYSYCHGKDIRQFKEKPRNPLSGNLKIEEDPDWKAYTLGTAPEPADDAGVELALAERYASVGALEIANNGVTQYLVQRWSNGTYCEKAGRPQTKTCSYIVVIQTSRLCDEPGFMSRRELGQEAVIKCREILAEGIPPPPQESAGKLPQGDMPDKRVQLKPTLPTLAAGAKKTLGGGKPIEFGSIAKALQEMLKSGRLTGGDLMVQGLDAEEDVVFDIIPIGSGEDGEFEVVGEIQDERIAEALRAAGITVSGQKRTGDGGTPEEGEEEAGEIHEQSLYDEEGDYLLDTEDFDHDEL